VGQSGEVNQPMIAVLVCEAGGVSMILVRRY
jgi:hypothetical protein